MIYRRTGSSVCKESYSIATSTYILVIYRLRHQKAARNVVFNFVSVQQTAIATMINIRCS